MTSLKLEYIINEAIRKVNKLRHEYLTIESILYVLLGDAFVERVLISCGADIDHIKSALNDFLNDDANFSILSDNEIEDLGKNQFADEKVRQIARQNGVYYQPELTISLQRVLQRAALHVQSSGKNQILGIHLLVSIFGEEESYALYLLKSMGIERLDIVQKIAHGDDHPITDQESEFVVPETGKKSSALAFYTENISEQIRSNKIDPIIGRKSEISRICQILCRRQKNNPLIVGDAGVGKTALAYGLAFAIEKKNVPEFLFETDIYSLDMMSLISGAKYRGEFEGRFRDVLKELKKVGESGKKAILFIDELHAIMGTGATSGGSLDASSLLKPALTSGEIRFMGSTTYDDYRKFIEKDHAFSRRFQNVEVNEPQFEEALQILKGLKPGFENHHKIEIPDEVLKTALDLSIKYITDRKLPDKAIDIIDEAGASLQIRGQLNPGSILSVSDIEETVAKMARLPEVTVRSNEKEKLKNLEKNLSLLIFGQDKAISKVVDTVLLARAGLGTSDKPVACFLFAGPTGVGKTELAKQLAFNLGIHFERIDMSEYMEKHSVSKLIGAPPGYIGHDQGGGCLTESIKKHPYSVLLLDEIEKAHFEVYNILLQIMDHGALTDSHGRLTNFQNTILIMTTNAGAKDMDAGAISIANSGLVVNNKQDKAIKYFFTPEFRNRLDDIIYFESLKDSVVVKIAQKFMFELESKLLAQNIELTTASGVLEFIAKQGFDPKLGARPISRYIDEHIKRKLSHKILFEEIGTSRKVRLIIKNNVLDFEMDN